MSSILRPWPPSGEGVTDSPPPAVMLLKAINAAMPTASDEDRSLYGILAMRAWAEVPGSRRFGFLEGGHRTAEEQAEYRGLQERFAAWGIDPGWDG